MKKCPPGKYYCTDRKKCMPIPSGYHVGRGGWLEKDKKNGSNNGNGSGNGNGSNGNGGNGNGNGGNGGGGVSESITIARQTGNVYQVFFSWRGKMIGLKLFFPQIKKPKRKEMQDAIQKIYPGSQLRSFEVSPHQPGEPYLNVGK